MFIPGIVQALIAALTFGIVLNAASSAVFLFAKGHGSKIFRDGLRLVLITFLSSAALWAQIDFAALTVDPTSTSGCQVAVIFTTIFDQLARFAIEQYLLWAINSNAEAPTTAIIPQAILGTRFILGAVFVGFQKPQIATVCVSKIEVLPIGVIVTITDFLIVTMLVFRANSVGLVKEAQSGQVGAQGKKAVLWTMAGLTVWTAGSIPMLLGVDSIDLIWRTALPATGLSLLVGLVTGFSDSLLPPRVQHPTHPDAQSPRNTSSSRDLSSSDTDYPPTRYEDLKAGTTTTTTITTFNQPRETPRPDGRMGASGALPIIAGSVPGQAATGVGGAPVQGQLFTPMRAQTAPVPESQRMGTKPKLQYKRSIFDRGGPGASIKNAISNPILQESGERNPLTKIATIDLETAARNDRERRDHDMATMQRSPSLIAQRPAPQPPVFTAEEALKRSQSMKRKEVGLKSPPAEQQPLKSAGLMSNPPATTSSAQLSPGVEEIRRRSPRHTPEPIPKKEKEVDNTLVIPKQAAPVSSVSPPRPPRPERPLSAFETVERSASQRAIATSANQKTIDRSASQESTATSAPAPSARGLSPPTGRVPPPPPKSAARLTSPKKPDLPSTWPIQSSVDPTIRPSRQKPLSPKNQDGAPPTGLQRRPTGGLPSNPRAMTLRSLPKDAAVPQEQTVMFVNNIQYNDPMGVQSIIQGAVNQAAKTPISLQSPRSALESSGSIVHRPRPIPRQQGKDRQIFPAENSPNHKRRKSGGSIISRKSILLSNPGSPTQLPPLPPPPKSAGGAPVRPLPNDTKSMTFDEKMDLFFPGPPSSSKSGSKSRQSIPELPALPAPYKLEGNVINEDRGGCDTESSRDRSNQSDRSTKTSVRTRSILQIDEAPRRPEFPRNTSKFSVGTSVITGKMVDDHESWIPDLPVDEGARSGRSYDGIKRQSSPVLPARNPSLSEFSEARTRDEETTTNWGSIHSPVAAVNIQEVTHMPKRTWIQPRDDRNPRDLSMISHNDGKEVMMIMLDASVEHERDMQAPPTRDEGPTDTPEVRLANRGARWHCRIGDERVTFSERKEKISTRRMPPPTPLQLRSPVKKNAVVLQMAEPSPLESPQHAYETIQAQLKKYEEPNRDSYESQGQRIRLLESLEAEMGQQENQWHEMQHGLTRDSLSTVGTTSVRNSQHDAANVTSHSRDSSMHSHIAADRRASRRARMQSVSSLSKSSTEDLRSALSASLDSNNRTSLWQQRLADAQMEYMENAPELLAKRNLNFLSVSKARMSAQLGSPTPPDTDESDGVDAQILATLMPKERAAAIGHLWEPSSSVHTEREPMLLWAPAHDVATRSPQSGVGVELPGLFVRPASRKISEPLAIDSSQLWQPDHTAAKKLRNSISGLWRSCWIPEPPKTQTRPVTQRPPRRSKRITLLPDILESPVPLPDKRGTLGIFQFPWGEKSDTATVQPRPSHMFMAMPGTMTTGGPAVRAALEARANPLEAQEYSSSFFDDYDEEEEGDDEVSDIGADDESDDGFDETTLWEIASLLQSDQVPSKNSLLPQAVYRPDSIVEDYVSQGSSEYTSEDEKGEDEDEGDTKHDSMVITVAAEEQISPSTRSSLLWTAKTGHSSNSRSETGLPQPDAHTWETYTVALSDPPRAPAQFADPVTVHSTSLWSPAVVATPKFNNSPLWSPSTTPAEPVSNPNSAVSQLPQRTTKTLWTAQPAIVETQSMGLFDPSHKRASFRATEAIPIGLSMTSTARATIEARPIVTSTCLWQPRQTSAQALWTAPQVFVKTEPKGLFSTSNKRVVFKRTSASPIGLSVPSTARVTIEELPVLTSTSLWRQQQASANILWVAPVVKVETQSNGLFNTSHTRATFRTTTACPIGLSMPSTAHTAQEVLPVLASTTLWVASTFAPQAHDWNFAGSIRSNSSLYTGSSGHSTPTLNTASTKSAGTEAVSDFEPLPEAVVKPPAWWESNSEFQAPIEKAAYQKPLRRTLATSAQWESALVEAMGATLADTPTRLVRTPASPEQWEEALKEAILSSNVAEVVVEERVEQPLEPPQFQQQTSLDQPQYVEQQFEQPQYFDQSQYDREQYDREQYELQLEQQRLFEQHEYERREYEQQLARQRYLEQQEYEQQRYFEQQQLERQQYFEQEEFAQQQYFQQMQHEQQQQYYEQQQFEALIEDQFEQQPEHHIEQELAPEGAVPTTSLPLWSAPEATFPKDTGIMWIPPTKSARHSHNSNPLTPEDSESRSLRRKQIKSQPITASLVNFEGQGMWDGTGARRTMPQGGGLDWLLGLPLMHA